jgi:tetratricopeptide (TPR) repeat protein
VGVVHEYAACDAPFVEERLGGDDHIESRRLCGRNLDPQKYERDCDLLLAEVDRNPGDARTVFYLAQSYYDLGDFGNARYWYARRAEMGDFAEEVYYALFRVAESMSRLGEPWPQVQDAYLRAWEYRPTRAEPLYVIAHRYRINQRYALGYLFAERAAHIPLPEEDTLFVSAEVYTWRALDEQAVCASWIGKNDEALALFQSLLTAGHLPDDERSRVEANCDICARL